MGSQFIFQHFLGLQYFALGICLVTTVVVMRQKKTAISAWMLCTTLFAMLQNLGYTMELISESKPEVLMALRFEYVGGCFMPTCWLFFVLIFCGVSLNPFVKDGILLFDTVCLFLVWNCTKHTLFYTSIDFVEGPAFSYLKLGRGIFYVLFMTGVCLKILACIIVAGMTYHKARGSETRKRYLYFITTSAIPGIGVVAGMFLHNGYDPVPLSIAMAMAVMLVYIIRERGFDIVASAHESIITTMSEGVIIVDRFHQFIEANESAYAIFPSLKNQKKESQLMDEELRQVFEKGENQEYEWLGHTYDVHINEITDVNESKGYAALFFDISKEKWQLAAMTDMRDEADAANHAKSDFLARMSHEIRTPINAVLGMNELILRDSDDPNAKRSASYIKTAAKTLLSLVDDILDTSKIASGRMKILTVKYEMCSLMHDLLRIVKPKANEKDLALNISIDPNLPMGLYGDDVRIRQILINLMSNAVKYTDEGQIFLTVTEKEREDDRIVLHFSVKDTGRGIKEEEISKLFELYRRADEEKNRAIEGTGLGLNIVSELLHMMGSELDVQSEYGKGSEFSFDLTQKIADESPIGNFKLDEEDETEEVVFQNDFEAPNASVLLVDDNQMNHLVFTGLLRPTLIKIDCVESGKKCLQKIQENKYDIIFLDHMMPEMDGIETFQHMQEMFHLNKQTPVVMLTANALVGAREKYLEEGFTDFISKPIPPKKLNDVIVQLLPDELKHMRKAGDVKTVSDYSELPPIDGFDMEFAKKFFNDPGLLLETMRQFGNGLIYEIKNIREAYEKEDFRLYQTKVHAVKSTAASIGALTLSKLSELSEFAVKEDKLEKMKALYPILMEEMEKTQEKLQQYFDRDEEVEKQKADSAITKSLLIRMMDGLLDYDYDIADEVVLELQKIDLSEPEEELLSKLEACVNQLEGTAAVDVIQEWIKVLKEGK